MKNYSLLLNQTGVALVSALVVLLILTLIGITAMNTTTIEEKMAINTQQSYASFHAAEIGISQAHSVAENINNVMPGQPKILGYTALSATDGYQVTVNSQGIGRAYSSSQRLLSRVSFELLSVGTASGNAATTVSVGIYRLVAKIDETTPD